jgi:hypothetical protein
MVRKKPGAGGEGNLGHQSGYDIALRGLGSDPYVGAFILSGEGPDAVEYRGLEREGERIKILKETMKRVASLAGKLDENPGIIYLKWDGFDVTLLDDDQIPESAKTWLNRGRTIKMMKHAHEKPLVISYQSPLIPGVVTVESPEIGSHNLGIARITDDEVIYTGHGRVRMSPQQHEYIGSPDRICVEWNGNKPRIFPYPFKNIMNGMIKTEDELMEENFSPTTINLSGVETSAYVDEGKKKTYRKINGTRNLFRKVLDEEISPVKPISAKSR